MRCVTRVAAETRSPRLGVRDSESETPSPSLSAVSAPCLPDSECGALQCAHPSVLRLGRTHCTWAGVRVSAGRAQRSRVAVGRRLHQPLAYGPAFEFPPGTRRGHTSPCGRGPPPPPSKVCTESHPPGTLQPASAEHGVWTTRLSCRANLKPCRLGGPAGPGPAAAPMPRLSAQAAPSHHASDSAGPTLLRRGPPPPESESHATGRPTPPERRLSSVEVQKGTGSVCRRVPSQFPGAAGWAADCHLPQRQRMPERPPLRFKSLVAASRSVPSP
jgi:hypothetical protein